MANYRYLSGSLWKKKTASVAHDAGGATLEQFGDRPSAREDALTSFLSPAFLPSRVSRAHSPHHRQTWGIQNYGRCEKVEKLST